MHFGDGLPLLHAVSEGECVGLLALNNQIALLVSALATALRVMLLVCLVRNVILRLHCGLVDVRLKLLLLLVLLPAHVQAH